MNTDRLPYEAPELRHYGAITQLVQGGSGAGVDGNMTTMMN